MNNYNLFHLTKVLLFPIVTNRYNGSGHGLEYLLLSDILM
jgi:hypothetical protein